MPALQIFGGIGIHVRGVITVLVARFPDQSLQCFQRCYFAVGGNPFLQQGDQRFMIAGINVQAFRGSQLCCSRQVFLHLGITQMVAYIVR